MRSPFAALAGTDRSHLVWWVTAAILALVTSGAAAWFITACGTTAFAWDEGEYVLQALETADRIRLESLFRWPWIVSHQQHYAKPPLLVNLIAGWLLLLGPTRLLLALGATSFTVTLSQLAVAGGLAGRLAGARAAFLAVLAVAAMPIVGRTTAEVFPEPLVFTLVLAVVALLYWPGTRWTGWRSVLLAVGFGLGLLAKASFPLLVIGPITVWLLYGRSDGSPPIRLRIAVLFWSGVGGLFIASIWYATNWREAIDYVGSAHAFNLRPGWSRSMVLTAWARALAFETFGAFGTVLTLGAAARLVASRVDRTRLPALALVAAGLPMLVAGLTSPNVASRLQLPAAGLVVVGSAMVVGPRARTRWMRVAAAALTLLVALQWLLVQGVPILRTLVPPVGRTITLAAGRLIHLMPSRPTGCPDPRPSNAVIDAMEDHAEDGLWPVCRLATNHGELNVGLLELASTARGLPARFSWATYFSWNEPTRHATIDEMLRSPTVVAALFPSSEFGGTDPVLNRFTDEVLDVLRQPSSGYSVWRLVAPPDGAFTLLLLRNFDPRESPPLRPVEAEFGGLMRVTGFATDDHNLLVEFFCLKRPRRNLAIAVRGTPSDQHEPDGLPPALEIDWPIVPSTVGWRPGRRYLLRVPMDGTTPGQDYSVVLSVFDPRRTGTGWFVLERSDGIPGSKVQLGEVRFELSRGTDLPAEQRETEH